MKMMFTRAERLLIYKLLLSCFTTIVYATGLIAIINDTLFNYVPFGLLTIISLTVFVVYLRIPKPSKEDVEAILGPDPCCYTGCFADGKMPVITTGAHRGAGLDAPENSLVAFKVCADKGVNLIEFDVAITADNVPVVFHDDTLERLTDYNMGLDSLTWEQLSKFDISIKHPYKEKYQNTFIPKLEDVVKQLLDSDQKMFIDLKGMNTKIVSVIVKLFADYPELHRSAIVSSFYPHLIYLIRRRNPKIVCSLAWRPFCFSTESFSFPNGVGPNRAEQFYKHYLNVALDLVYEWSLSRIIYYICGISVILLHKDVICGKIILDWRAKGVRVVAWTVNHPLEKQHFSRILKVTYLTDTLIGETTAHLPCSN